MNDSFQEVFDDSSETEVTSKRTRSLTSMLPFGLHNDLFPNEGTRELLVHDLFVFRMFQTTPPFVFYRNSNFSKLFFILGIGKFLMMFLFSVELHQRTRELLIRLLSCIGLFQELLVSGGCFLRWIVY
ncbi:hypothetical protein PanWU01x14_054410 [Parasponia andersonii]|uniref:Transmembrane protein n=1 Tax=Parasponia andersonii TaxID=3476 RepID=A0A2P5DKR6_PARAD|nr:hypothetical protein PanWU01x14_054410 [Parasponia andersonii]